MGYGANGFTPTYMLQRGRACEGAEIFWMAHRYVYAYLASTGPRL